MNSRTPEAFSVEAAAAAVSHARATFMAEYGAVPFCRPTDLGVLSPEEQGSVKNHESEHYRNRPELSAVHFCLTSAEALLEISRTLLAQPALRSPQENERHWKALSEDAKLAGRAAYRAVLILSDPASSRGRDTGYAPAFQA